MTYQNLMGQMDMLSPEEQRTLESMTAAEAKEMCEVVAASCYCLLPPGHKGSHKCKCGGGWGFNEGRFYIASLPDITRQYLLSPEEKEIVARNKKDPNETSPVEEGDDE